MYESELPSELREFLLGKGYRVVAKLGEGQTSDVYETDYKEEGVEQRRVIKIPKQDVTACSPTTLMNLSNGSTNEHEILILNRLSHPNIIQVHQAFRWNGMTIPVEEHYDGVSLEDLIRMQGPLDDREKFKHRFTQIIEAMRWLNLEQGILHRDLKPSNILVGRHTNHVKICDMQTAGKRESIYDKMLPTRGATQYTRPNILNSIMERGLSHCTVCSEIYAIGAVMFHSLTGEPLFDRKLLEDPDGTQVPLEEKVIGLSLYENGRKVERIDIAKHDKDLKKRLKLVPRPYRSLIRNCVSHTSRYDTIPDYQVYDELKKDFSAATRADWSIDWKLIAGCFVSSCLFIGCLAKDLEPAVKIHPTISVPFFQRPVSDSIENLLPVFSDEKQAKKTLKPYFIDLKRDIARLHFNFPVESDDPQVQKTCDRYHFSSRLAYSLARSILMHTTSEEDTFFGSKYRIFRRPVLSGDLHRLRDFLVPTDYVRTIDPNTPMDRNHNEELSYAVSLLKNYSNACASVEDLFVSYYTDNESHAEAKKKAGSLSLFGTDSKPGYLKQFDMTRQDLICKSIALAYITDETGKIKMDKLQSIVKSYGSVTSPKRVR